MREHQQATVLVNTIEYNKSKYSSSDYSRAVDARKVQNIIGAPTFKQYRHIVDSNTMRNCPLLPTDIEAAEDIFGKNIQILKGRTTNKKSMHLRSYVTKIPITILEKYKLVTITGDIMFVNKLRFVITKSRAIKFTTSQFINSAKETDLFESILATKKIYRRRGFDVNIILMDGQFECIRTHLLGAQISLNICANNEHVHEI